MNCNTPWPRHRQAARIALVADLMVTAFREGRKVLLFGNGGSGERRSSIERIDQRLFRRFGGVGKLFFANQPLVTPGLSRGPAS